MPKGDIILKSGASVHYDDVKRAGDLVVIKRSYTHDVEVIRASEVDDVVEGEWHQTPIGYCKSLSKSEVSDAIDRSK